MPSLRRLAIPLGLGALCVLLAGGIFFHSATRAAWSDIQAEADAARKRLSEAPVAGTSLAGPATFEGSAFDAYEAAAAELLGTDRRSYGSRVQEITRLTTWGEGEESLATLRTFVAEPSTQAALARLRRGASSSDKRPKLDWTSAEDLPLLMETSALRTAAIAQATVLAAEGRDEEAAAWHVNAAQLGIDLLGGHTLITSAIGYSIIDWAFYDDRGPAGDYAVYGRASRRLLLEAAHDLDGAFAFDPLVFDGEFALAVGFMQSAEKEGVLGPLHWRSSLDLPQLFAALEASREVSPDVVDAYRQSDALGFAAFREMVNARGDKGIQEGRVLVPIYGGEMSRVYARSKVRAVALALALSLGDEVEAGEALDALGVPFQVETTGDAVTVASQKEDYTEFSIRVAPVRQP